MCKHVFTSSQANEQRLRSPYEAKCISDWDEVDIYPEVASPDDVSKENRVTYSKEVRQIQIEKHVMESSGILCRESSVILLRV